MKENTFTPVKATANIFFDKDHACCAYCPLFETYSREQCRMTGDYIFNKYGRGWNCPLVFQEVKNEIFSDAET